MYITTALTSAVLLCLSVHVHAEVVPSDGMCTLSALL